MFNIPVALILFRRSDTLESIVNRLREVQPSKVYLLGDEGRNDQEKQEVHKARTYVESLIDWPCIVVKHYAGKNRGVYGNIGEGAKWVFQREEKAIFIEDDNLPQTSFFRFAEEMLERYEENPSVAWICGTNYVTDMRSDVSYAFTKHLLPCGWASWGKKFNALYDGYFDKYRIPSYRKAFRKSYRDKLLMMYQEQLIKNEIYRNKKTGRFVSWDYQMLWSVRSQGMYGLIPMQNQITNIGIDEFSVHGGSSRQNVMTSRFCEIPSKEMAFPLRHPGKIEIDAECERIIGDIICPPTSIVIKKVISSNILHLFNRDPSESLKEIIIALVKRT